MKLTEKAAVQTKKIMEEQEIKDYHLRVKITAGGCSGHSYSLNFDDQIDSDKDDVEVQHGINLVIDKKSALYLDEVTLDWKDDDLGNMGFDFINPAATRTCGCNKSFSV